MNEDSLRSALLAAEPSSAEMRERYRARLHAITERRMTPALKIAHGIGLVIALATAVRCALLFARAAGHLPAMPLVGLTLAFVFCTGWVVATGWAIASGADRVFGNSAVRSWLIVGFSFLTALLMLWAGLTSADATQGVRFLFFGLTFWCLTGPPFLVHQLVSEMRAQLRVDLLRLELAQAERDGSREVRP